MAERSIFQALTDNDDHFGFFDDQCDISIDNEDMNFNDNLSFTVELREDSSNESSKDDIDLP